MFSEDVVEPNVPTAPFLLLTVFEINSTPVTVASDGIPDIPPEKSEATFAAVVKDAPELSVALANILVSLVNRVRPPVDVTEVGAASTLGIVILFYKIKIFRPKPSC